MTVTIKHRNVYLFIVSCSLLAIVSCNLFKIEVSDKRNPVLRTLLLEKNIEISAPGAIRISKTDFFPACFCIKVKDKLLYIDPIKIGDTVKADYILITHAHPDHFSKQDIHKLLKPETIIICPRRVAKRLDRQVDRIVKVEPGDSLTLDDHLKIEAIAAYNLEPAFLWLKGHPKAKKNTGYVVTSNRTRIYHAGDTDYVPEMDRLRNINLALIPIGDDHLTMDVEAAVGFINHLKPEYVIPMHYDMKERNDLEKFRGLIDQKISVIILE